MYLAAYDIADNGERKRVSRILDGYGHGIQRSVYVCHVREAQARRMLTALRALNVRTGFILVWKVPDSAMPESVGACPPQLPLIPEHSLII